MPGDLTGFGELLQGITRRRLMSEIQAGKLPVTEAGVTSFTPGNPKLLARMAAQILKSDYLGFDTLAQAKQAILRSPDWATRWDVTGHAQQVLSAWKEAVKAGKLTAYADDELDEVLDVLGPRALEPRASMNDLRALVQGSQPSTVMTTPNNTAKLLRQTFSVIPGGKTP